MRRIFVRRHDSPSSHGHHNRSAALLALAIGVLLTQFGMMDAAFAQSSASETTGEQTWWLHENVFPESGIIDGLFYFCLYLTCATFVAVFAVMLYFLVKYRYQPGRQALFTHGNPKLEIVWTLIPTLILAGTAAFSQAGWSQMKYWPEVDGEEEPVYVDVIGMQFQWVFHYPGPDGKFGPRKRELIDKNGAMAEQQVGLDRSHPDAKDDFVTGDMVVPVNRKVLSNVISRDVLHSFFLPNFRVKQDAVPALNARVWFRSAKTSREVIGNETGPTVQVYDLNTGEPTVVTDAKPFDIICAELCGASHYTMRGKLYVVTPDEYERFVAANVKNAMPESGESEEEGYE